MELTHISLVSHSLRDLTAAICMLLLIRTVAATDLPSQTAGHVTSTASISTSSDGSNDGRVTTQSVGDVSFPCQCDSCSYRTPSTSNGGGHIEPCLPANHELVRVKHFSTYTLSDKRKSQSLPRKKWLLLKDDEDNCLHILTVNSTDSVCMLPGYCNSQFPWYVRLTSPLLRDFGEETRAELCMTDTTSLGKATCCRHAIKLRIRSCGSYWIYNFPNPMPSSAAGEVCSERNSVAHELSLEASNSVTTVSSVNMKYTIEEWQLLPKTLDELNDAEKSTLVTIVFEFYIARKVQVRDLINAYHEQVVEGWNVYFQKQANNTGDKAMNLGLENIYRVAGSPEYVQENGQHRLYYTLYATTDEGEALPHSVLIEGIDSYNNARFSQWHAYITETIKGYPEELSYPQRTTTIAATTIKTSPSSLTFKSSYDWRILIYIVVATVGTIALTFLALCVYRVKLSTRVHTNRSKRLSRIEKWMLSNEHKRNETELPLQDGGTSYESQANESTDKTEHAHARRIETETNGC